MGNDRIKGITIEINGDTLPLKKAMEGITKEGYSLQAQLRDVNRLLKLDPKNTELLRQKQDLLAKSIENTKTKLESLKNAEAQAKEQLAKGEISQEQYNALQREIAATTEKLKDLEKQSKKTNESVSGIGKAGEALGKFGEKATAAGKKLLPVSAGVAAVGGASAKMAMDFEDAMAKVSTIADTTEVPLDQLRKSILDLSNQTGISSSEIAGNVYDAISAGQKTGDAVNFVTNSTKLAKAGFTDAGNSLDILTTILNAYEMEASEVTKVSDTLIQTQNLGKTTVNELASSMGKIIPTAKANNVALDQVSAGYAIMTANGVATAETTTYMNSMLNELGKSGTKVSDVLKKETGKSFSQLMAEGASLSDALEIVSKSAKKQGLAFTDMWGSAEAGKAALILLGDGAEKFNGTLEQMQNSTGATDAAFEKLQTKPEKIRIALNQLKNTGIELGTAIMSVLAPIIESLANKIQGFTSWFSGLSDGAKQMIVVIGGIVAAVGPLLILVGKFATGIAGVMKIIGPLKTAFGALNTVISANPIILIVAAIAALVAGFIYLWNNCEAFRNFWIGLWNSIKAAFDAVWNAIVSFFTQTIPNAINGIKEKFSQFSEWIGSVFSTDWSKHLGVIGDIINGLFQNISNIWNSIKKVFQGVIDFIVGVFTGDWGRAWQGIQNIFKGVWDGLVAIAKAPVNAIIALINGVISALNFMIQGLNHLSFDIPDWVPFLGGKKFGFNIPEIGKFAYLAKGGTLWSGNAIVGEKGPELLSLINGKARVTPLTNSQREAGAAIGGGININIENFVNNDSGKDIKQLVEIITNELQSACDRRGRALC